MYNSGLIFHICRQLNYFCYVPIFDLSTLLKEVPKMSWISWHLIRYVRTSALVKTF